jgi:hypothetical protein
MVSSASTINSMYVCVRSVCSGYIKYTTILYIIKNKGEDTIIITNNVLVV